MAPFLQGSLLLLKPREDVTATPFNNSVAASSGENVVSHRPWVIPVIVAGVILLSALTIWAFVYFNRRREFGKARSQEPYLSRPEFDKRRKMSSAEKLEEEEKQRIIMIRKSLASRSWASSAGSASSSRRVSQISEGQQHERPTIPEMVEAEMEDHREPKPLKDDWKAYEAELQRETSRERHPAAESETAAQEMGLTRPTRSLSPSRSPLLTQLPGTPPR